MLLNNYPYHHTKKQNYHPIMFLLCIMNHLDNPDLLVSSLTSSLLHLYNPILCSILYLIYYDNTPNLLLVNNLNNVFVVLLNNLDNTNVVLLALQPHFYKIIYTWINLLLDCSLE